MVSVHIRARSELGLCLWLTLTMDGAISRTKPSPKSDLSLKFYHNPKSTFSPKPKPNVNPSIIPNPNPTIALIQALEFL